ncbi:MAG: (2Fe-2S)-binding protein [Firmicutes bacterium]|nr:(2Fe-2S)-binding protein [Bacillota bacterium]
MSDRIICRCEEVTEEEIRMAIRDGATTLTEVKRRTRAGMGLCQGRTCRKLVAQIIAQETGVDPAIIPPPTTRPPVRAIKLGIIEGEK